jgi:hypothetical protein
MKSQRNTFTVVISGERVDVLEPSIDELQAFRVFPRELTPRRPTEVSAWIDQVRLRLTSSDRRLLASMRIAAPADFCGGEA